MAYRTSFNCLWCGTDWTTRGADDLEGWAQLCPDCLGRAGSNPFLRRQLRTALEARAAGAAGSSAAASAAGAAGASAAGAGSNPPVAGAQPSGRRASTAATAPAFPDDWFLRRGSFERGAIHDAAWAAELDVITRWLDGLPPAGRIIELAAGTGFFSPLLAERRELWAFDADEAALELARGRLVAHRLRAHLHAAGPWAALPAAADPGPVDAVVAAFLLGRVRGAGLDLAAASLRGRLRDGGRLAAVELRPDPAGGPPPGIAWTWHDPALIEAALLRAGFGSVDLRPSGRFFLALEAIAR